MTSPQMTCCRPGSYPSDTAIWFDERPTCVERRAVPRSGLAASDLALTALRRGCSAQRNDEMVSRRRRRVRGTPDPYRRLRVRTLREGGLGRAAPRWPPEECPRDQEPSRHEHHTG